MSLLIRWTMVSVIILGGLQLFQLKRTAHYINASFVAEGLASATRLKVMVAQHYYMQGELPSSHEEANIPPPESFATKALKSATIMGKGTIKLLYNEKSGIDGGSILLIPNQAEAMMDLTWRCVSFSFKGIEKIAPQCSYQGE